MKRRMLIFSVLFGWLVSCSPRVSVKPIAPVRMKHTYAIEIMPMYKPDDLTKRVMKEMKWVLEWDYQVFTVLPSSKECLKESEVTSLKTEADALILLRKVAYAPEMGELKVELEFYELATHIREMRQTELKYHHPARPKEEVLKVLARKMTRDMLEQLEISDEASLSTGFGGMLGGGPEGIGGGGEE